MAKRNHNRQGKRRYRSPEPLPPGLKPLTVSPRVGQALLGISTTKFYELINAGEIRRIKHGNKALIIYETLENFIARQSTAAHQSTT